MQALRATTPEPPPTRLRFDVPDPGSADPDVPGSRWGALRRKVARSLAARGPAGTLARLITWPMERVASRLRERTPTRRRYRVEERTFDERFGVDTREDDDPRWMVRIPGDSWRHGRGYEPATFHDVTTALDLLDLDASRFTFVDLGAGKGRVLLLAADRPFRRVTGVEYSPRLCAIGAENLARYRAPERRCDDLSIVEGDAAAFDFPLEPLVLFFHHPFDAPVFRVVLERLERSLADLPRPVVVVYVDPRCGDLFDASPWFRRRPIPADAAFTAPVAIFEFVGGVRRSRRPD